MDYEDYEELSEDSEDENDEDDYLLDFTGEDVEDDEDGDDEEETSRTYRLDLDAGRIIGMTDRLDAVIQAIRKVIATPRFDCLIYDDQYGSETASGNLAEGATQAYLETAIEGFIRDALSQDTRILDIGDFEIEFEDDSTYISFSIDTIFGSAQIEEVI